MELRPRGRVNKVNRYENVSQSKSKSRDHSYDHSMNNVMDAKKFIQIKRETVDGLKRNVVTPDRKNIYSRHNETYDILHSPINITNKNIKRNHSEDKIIYKKERNLRSNNQNHNQLLMRYNNSPSPLRDYKTNMTQIPQKKKILRTSDNGRKLTDYTQIPIPNLNFQIESNNHHMSYTKYAGSSLQYSNTSCWSDNNNTNIKSTVYNQNTNPKKTYSKIPKDYSSTQMSSSHNKTPPQYHKTSTHYQYKSPQNYHSNDNKYHINPSPTQKENDSYYNYTNYILSSSNNNNNNLTHNNYQRIPIKSQMLNDESSIHSKSSTSHSPSFINNQIGRTPSTGNRTFNDSYLYTGEKRSNTIETIEEMHFALVNIIQNGKQLMLTQEDKTKNGNPFGTVTDLEERDLSN